MFNLKSIQKLVDTYPRRQKYQDKKEIRQEISFLKFSIKQAAKEGKTKIEVSKSYFKKETLEYFKNLGFVIIYNDIYTEPIIIKWGS